MDDKGNSSTFFNKPPYNKGFIKLVKRKMVSNCEIEDGDISFTNQPMKVLYSPMAENLRRILMQNNGFTIIQESWYQDLRLAIAEVGFVYSGSFCWVNICGVSPMYDGVWVAFRKQDILSRLKVLAGSPEFVNYVRCNKLYISIVNSSGKITRDDVTKAFLAYHGKVSGNRFKLNSRK